MMYISEKNVKREISLYYLFIDNKMRTTYFQGDES